MKFKDPLCVIGTAEFGNATDRVCGRGTPGCLVRHGWHVDPGVHVIAIGRPLTDEELRYATEDRWWVRAWLWCKIRLRGGGGGEA